MCAKTVQKYDESIVRSWTEEIDTLLVFVCANLTFTSLAFR